MAGPDGIYLSVYYDYYCVLQISSFEVLIFIKQRLVHGGWDFLVAFSTDLLLLASELNKKDDRLACVYCYICMFLCFKGTSLFFCLFGNSTQSLPPPNEK